MHWLLTLWTGLNLVSIPIEHRQTDRRTFVNNICPPSVVVVAVVVVVVVVVHLQNGKNLRAN